MRQAAAKYDLHTTEGLAQVQHLRFILPSGEVDTQYNGMTIRGGVLDDGIREMPGSEIIDGRCALQLPRLAAGCHRYDALISGSGTDMPLLAGVIHVAPRVTPVDMDDSTPADYLDLVIPADEGGTITVISETPAWVDDAVEQSLQARGMYVTPHNGEGELASNMGFYQSQPVTFYRLPLNHHNIAGHAASRYEARSVTIRPLPDQNNPEIYIEIYKLKGSAYELLGRSASSIKPTAANQDYTWEFPAGLEVRNDDVVMLRMVGTDGNDAVIKLWGTNIGTLAGAGIVSGLVNPELQHERFFLYTKIGVAYTEGVSVGGVELATKDHFDALTTTVIEAGAQVAGDAQTASDAATAAQQAADSIPIDANGNMTLPGNLTAQGGTFARTVNANGGVNIPLTATPSVQTHAVNRVLAGGMAVVADACNPQVFLSSRTTYGSSVSVTDVVPGFLWQLKNSASSSSPVNGTVRVGFDSTLVGRSNYGTIWGYVIPYRPASSKHKVTFTTGMFRESECVISTEQPIDMYTVSPKPSNKSSWLRIIDITFHNEMDSSSVPVGYPVRVRELVYDKSNDKWVVYTTVSVISAFNTQSNNTQAIVYQQNPDDTGCQAGLWLIVQGAAGQRTLRLADLHGVSDSFGWEAMSPVWWDAGYGSAHIGAPRVTQVYSPDRVNGAYHAFTAIESRQIQSTSSADFNHYE